MRNGRTTLLLLFVFALAGCVASPGLGPTSAGYDAIIPNQRILISEPGGEGKWEGPDLSIEYRYAVGPRGMTIWGTVNFLDSLRYGFGLLNYFNGGIILSDAEGRPLGSIGLVSTRQSGLDSWSVPFNRAIALPPGTAAFAFTYDGQLIEVVGHRGRGGGGNQTRIWHYPISRVSVPQQGMK